MHRHLSPARKGPMQGEHGSITTFSLMTLIGMIGIGGLAVDAMYFEGKRVAAQDAMDRCSLMAAVAQNRIDGGAATGTTAQAIANDCMAKSTVGSAGLNTPTVSSGNSERSVTLSGNYTFSALFPNFGNAASKSYTVTSKSTQKLPNLEISLAIDTTHSTFLASMRDPLKVFLNTIAAPDTGNKVSVNIIPYGRSVFLGSTLIERFNDTHKPSFSNTASRACLNFSQAERGELGIAFADPYIWSWPVSLVGTNYSGGNFETVEAQNVTFNASNEATSIMNAGGNCERQTNPLVITGNTPLIGAQVARPVTTGSSVVNNKLNGIVATPYAQGSAVDTLGGLKWALAALDPSLAPIITGQISDTISPPPVAGRPLEYTAQDSMKVLIFITNSVFNPVNADPTQTDGGNMAREIRPEFLADTPSTVWRTPGNATPTQPVRLSVFHDNAPDPTRPYWVSQGLTAATRPPSEDAQWLAAPYQHPGGAAPVRLTWREVMSQVTLITLIRQLHMAPFSPVTNTTNTWSALVDKFTYVVRDNAQDRENFAALCAAAKEKGILVYMLRGPGSERVGGSTASVLAHNANADLAGPIYDACATSVAHTFSMGVSTLKPNLRLIASNIAQLTLTQ